MSQKTLQISTKIMMALLALNFVGNIYGITLGGEFQMACNLFATIFAFFYLLLDFTKSGNLYFKLFMWFLVFKEACALVNMAITVEVTGVAFVLVLLCYTCTTILAVSLNLGKKRSFIFVGALIFFSLCCLLYSFVAGEYVPVITHIYNATRLLLSLAAGVMIYAKYEDKAARGRD